jgi:hypothetical protein
MTPSNLTRWGATAAVVAAMLGGAVALVQFFLGPIGGYRCEEPVKALADMNSLDDLRARFNDATGSPRLVLLLSPT